MLVAVLELEPVPVGVNKASPKLFVRIRDADRRLNVLTNFFGDAGGIQRRGAVLGRSPSAAGGLTSVSAAVSTVAGVGSEGARAGAGANVGGGGGGLRGGGGAATARSGEEGAEGDRGRRGNRGALDRSKDDLGHGGSGIV